MLLLFLTSLMLATLACKRLPIASVHNYSPQQGVWYQWT